MDRGLDVYVFFNNDAEGFAVTAIFVYFRGSFSFVKISGHFPQKLTRICTNKINAPYLFRRKKYCKNNC
ncbi:MAG: hypothetical protein SWH68_16745 [Thermodesulfobacteriota bacterium]|nr:hypothetical protein [Thermodesulfobacteriota bacterium]